MCRGQPWRNPTSQTLRDRASIMRGLLLSSLLVIGPTHLDARAADPGPANLDSGFSSKVRPFIQQYCIECHSKATPEADLDLESYLSYSDAAKDSIRWGVILE